MKSVVVNRILIVLMISVIFSPSFVQTSIAAEKWEANMKKDFTKVLREKKETCRETPRIYPEMAETGTTLHTPNAL